MAITAKCTHKCPGGRECTCNGMILHEHHICRTPGCACHTAEAYGLEMVTDARQAVYVPARTQRIGEGTGASPTP